MPTEPLTHAEIPLYELDPDAAKRRLQDQFRVRIYDDNGRFAFVPAPVEVNDVH